jgi:hypothetical protein
LFSRCKRLGAHPPIVETLKADSLAGKRVSNDRVQNGDQILIVMWINQEHVGPMPELFLRSTSFLRTIFSMRTLFPLRKIDNMK